MHTIGSIINPAHCAPGTVESTACVCAAAAHMNHLGVRSLLVVDRDGGLIGILTESDVLVGVVAAELDPASVTVEQVMTTQLPTISPSASLEEAMELMTSGGHQQLLVANDSEILGLVSISEVSRSLVQDRDALIGDLTYYITH